MSVTTAVFAAAMPACTSSPVGGSGASGGSGGSGGTAGAGGRAVITGSGGAASGGPGGASSGGKAAGAAAKLGRTPHFLIGMGNDLDNDHNKDGAYTLGVTMDLHDAYLVGAAPGKGGWPEWNAGGAFVNVLSDSAAAHGTTPMYTLYSMAALGDGNLSGLGTDAFMTWYWSDAKLLFQRIALFGKPALVHVEPDFWAYAQQAAAAAGGPQKVKVRISGLAADCAGLPEDLTGLGHCFIKLARTYAPLALVGFHASRWAGPTADMITFLAAIGATESDVIVEDMLDRDAGCFEAHVDPSCQRNDGPWYWDESNQTTPNFHEYLAWSKAIGDGLGKPVVWWQVPFGVPSPSPGGTPGHYRDDRVHYIFNHIDEFLAAGGLGVAFGTGAGNQTYIDTDGNQFRDAVARYFASPVPLP